MTMTDDVRMKHVACPPAAVPYHYTACGLENVYLLSGYTVEEHDGEKYVSVKDVEELYEAIAEKLVTRRKVLAGKEVRFLRKLLGYSQAKLGLMLGLSDQMVARYEKEQSTLEGAADTLLRAFVLCKIDGEADLLADIERLRMSDERLNDRMTLVHGDNGEWRDAA